MDPVASGLWSGRAMAFQESNVSTWIKVYILSVVGHVGPMLASLKLQMGVKIKFNK